MLPILIPVGAALGLAVIAVGTLYTRARGDYTVLPTVADDPSLPVLEIDGYRFHAETHGDPTNPTVIVLHGGPGADYRSLLRLGELAETHHVVFYDQRGAGLSQRVPADTITASVMLDDVARIADRFSPTDPVTLIGHSWGATLAAGYMRHQPERVAAAVLAEPGYLDRAEYVLWQQRYDDLMKGWDTTKLMLQAGFEAQHVDGPDDHAGDDYLVGQCMIPAFVNHPDNPYHRPGQPYTAPSWRFGKAASDALTGETFGTSTDFDGPILFLAGADNDWIGEPLQRRHAARYPNAELAVVPDAAHDMVWDNPTHTVAIIRDFLARSSDRVSPSRADRAEA
jgi:proline iminopeptidase